jgi:hypothetical protein
VDFTDLSAVGGLKFRQSKDAPKELSRQGKTALRIGGLSRSFRQTVFRILANLPEAEATPATWHLKEQITST